MHYFTRLPFLFFLVTSRRALWGPECSRACVMSMPNVCVRPQCCRCRRRRTQVFEVNSRALKKNLPDPYPQSDVLKIILEMGGKLTLADDSHGPLQVCRAILQQQRAMDGPHGH